jgi:hypothetical protein
MKPLFRISAPVLSTLAAAMLTACGGSNDTPQLAGKFLDSAVEGLDYKGSSGTVGTTDVQGGFSCKDGETLTFAVGGVVLGTASCQATVTPMALASSGNTLNDAVVNRLVALQVLDEDDDPSNGIKLTAAVKSALGKASLDFSATPAAFEPALAALLAKLPADFQGRTIGNERRALAREHFENTLATQLGTAVTETVTQAQAVGSVQTSITRYHISADPRFYVPYEGSVAAVKNDFPTGFLPSYGSGLAFKGKAADGSLEFYGITDRGPNGDGPKVPNSVLGAGATGTSDGKLFPSPSFAPAIGVISVGRNGAVLKSSMPIKVSASVNASGLAIAAGKPGASGEIPLNDALRFDASSKTAFSDNGLDTESVVLDTARGAFWVSDEYGPFIVKIDLATGIIQKKYQPGTGASDLPAVLAKRRANRGMEGLSLDPSTAKLNGFIQSPLDDGKADYVLPGATAATSQSIKDYAKFNRWVEFDPATEKTRLFAYPIDSTQYSSGKTGGAKLGDLVALGNGKFIVIEQGAGVDGKVFNHLMLVQVPANATDIAAMGTDLEKSSMTGAAVNGVNYASVAPLKKTLLLDLNKAGWLAEKAEGLALVDDSTLALVNDNDFGLKTQIYSASGAPQDGDITKCTVDASGALVTTAGASGCTAGNTARVTKGAGSERPARLWTFKFAKKLADYSSVQ